MANPKKTTTVASTPAVATPAVAPVAAPVVADKKEKKVAVAPAAVVAPTSSSVKKSSSKKSETPVAQAEAPVAVAAPVAAVAEEKAHKERRVATRETIDTDFTDLIAKIATEIEKRAPAAPAAEETSTEDAAKKAASHKRKKNDGVPVKFLRTINKRLQALQIDVNRQTKLKKKVARNNENSGLMKPVKISESLFKFLKGAGIAVEKDQMYPRVEITRHIHNYVKDNKLRKGDKLTEEQIKENPKLSDKRVIFPDSKLASLLEYDVKNATEELTYFRLPQYLKNHFISEEKK